VDAFSHLISQFYRLDALPDAKPTSQVVLADFDSVDLMPGRASSA